MIIFIVVVFPAPFGPRRPKISPESTEKSMTSTALMSGGYAFTRFSTTTAFAGGPLSSWIIGTRGLIFS